jgi:hypothetical protein
MSFSNFLETTLLDLVFNGTSYAGQATVYVKLHIGDPGDAGTANAAAHTTRVSTTFGAASGNAIANDAACTFTSMAAAETISYVSIWDHLSAGNCLAISNVMSPTKTVAIGDTLNFPIGDIDVTLD